MVIRFDQEIRLIPAFSEIMEQGLIEIDGTLFPVLKFEVVPDINQDPSKVLFEWKASEMTEREARFRLFFKTGVYISSKEGPDFLKVTFRDPYLFIGVNNLSINV